jgi:hypothetical protein
MSPSLYGGKDGKYLGLIQFSPENQKKYGVNPTQTAAEQMPAVEAYLRDRGVKPGMGLLDTYSAINAGRPGLYNRSDAANGGTPGTVADKVASMAGHRMRANALLDRYQAPPRPPTDIPPPTQVADAAPIATPAAQPIAPVAAAFNPNISPQTPAPSPSAPMSLAPPSPGPRTAPAGDDPLSAALHGLASFAGTQPQGNAMQPMQQPEIQYFKPNLDRARALMAAMNRHNDNIG